MSEKSSGGGIGICTILFIVFLTLKLAEVGAVKDWSWWWVTSPLWIPLLIVLFVFGVFLAVIGIATILGIRR